MASSDETKKISRNRGPKFSCQELNILTRLINENPVIEKKQHDKNNEYLKKCSWIKIHEKFNMEFETTSRTLEQLKNAWKRMKGARKRELAVERRQKFATGGGPPPPSVPEDDTKKILDGILSNQTPLSRIPDDDDIDSLENCHYSLEEETLSAHLDSPLQQTTPPPSTSWNTFPAEISSETPSLAPPNPSYSPKSGVKKNKTPKKISTFAKQFHDRKMAYLKEEHDLKMQVLHEELLYWQEMREKNQQQVVLYQGDVEL